MVPLVAQYLCDATRASYMIVERPGAVAADYPYMAHDVGLYSCRLALVVSMGNDLIRKDVNPEAIAEQLKEAGAMYCTVRYIYGGSAALWGYGADSYDNVLFYDHHFGRVCSLVGGFSGAEELQGAQTADKIGHLRPASMHILCKAFETWVRDAMPVQQRSKL